MKNKQNKLRHILIWKNFMPNGDLTCCFDKLINVNTTEICIQQKILVWRIAMNYVIKVPTGGKNEFKNKKMYHILIIPSEKISLQEDFISIF